jgi:transcriptional regulator with XRE-family HTH domain
MSLKLKEIRIKKGLTAKDMAELLKISRAYYSQIENDKRTLSYKMAINISNILKTKPDDIFYKEYIEKIKK